MASRTDTLPERYTPRLRGKEFRWNDLRRIGNSPVARASIAIPVLGYLILFHSDLIDYLKLHGSVCKDCTVSWRLHLFYFSSCCFAFGSVVYALRCPQVIKKYGVARDYFETEKTYFCGNLRYLFHQFDQDGIEPADPSDLRSLALQRHNLAADRAHELGGPHGAVLFQREPQVFCEPNDRLHRVWPRVLASCDPNAMDFFPSPFALRWPQRGIKKAFTCKSARPSEDPRRKQGSLSRVTRHRMWRLPSAGFLIPGLSSCASGGDQGTVSPDQRHRK
jgi:hypothetical protein